MFVELTRYTHAHTLPSVFPPLIFSRPPLPFSFSFSFPSSSLSLSGPPVRPRNLRLRAFRVFDDDNARYSWAWSQGIHPYQHGKGEAAGKKYLISVKTVLLMTLGEGQGAKTDGEHLFVILVLLTGAMVNAALFGQMALLIANFNRAGSRYQEKMDSVSEHTKNLGLDVDLCHKIQDYCEWEWQLNRCLDRNLFIASLSPALQDEICVLIAYEVVRRVPFMKDMEEACLVEVLKCIVSTLHLRDDLVVRSGRIGRDMCTSVLGRFLVN